MRRNTVGSPGSAEPRSGSAQYKGSSATAADDSPLSDKSSAQHDFRLGSSERRSGSALYKGSSAIGADYSALSDESSAQHDFRLGFSGAALEFSAMQGISSEQIGRASCREGVEGSGL